MREKMLTKQSRASPNKRTGFDLLFMMCAHLKTCPLIFTQANVSLKKLEVLTSISIKPATDLTCIDVYQVPSHWFDNDRS